MKISGLFAACLCSATALAGTNLTFLAPVTVLDGPVNGADVSTLTDGVFRPRETNWQDGTVWWDEGGGAHPTLRIDFGLATVEQLTVQCDDNDAYRLWYRDLGTDQWALLWDVPNYDDFGSGMQTRPDPSDDSARYTLASSVTTNALLFESVSGDSLYSVSEIAAFGEFVPGPGSLALMSAALGAGLRRRR